jgi:hypothetical protein
MPLQLVVFDLDFCVWKHEMLLGTPQLTPAPKYQSWAEKKFSKTTTDGMILVDGSGTTIEIFPGA